MEETYQAIIRENDRCRAAYSEGIEAYLKRLAEESYASRDAFMPTENFPDAIETYRDEYVRMLGLHRIHAEGAPASTIVRVGEDEDAVIYRVTVYVTREIPQFGLLFVPHGIQHAPLVIAQHGGGGTPELCSDMNGKNNYNHMVRRILKRGLIVYAPQLLLWKQSNPIPTIPAHPIPYHRENTDKDLKHYGLSITALEIKGIMNSITFLSELPFIEKENVVMMGLSYGGYFTTYTMAADKRIKAGFSNAIFNDRNAYPRPDWCYPNSANTFHDAEVAALCAPRRLYIAVGKADEVQCYQSAIPEAERARKYFAAAAAPENFRFELWEGGHTVPDTDEGFDFLFSVFQ